MGRQSWGHLSPSTSYIPVASPRPPEDLPASQPTGSALWILLTPASANTTEPTASPSLRPTYFLISYLDRIALCMSLIRGTKQ